MALRSPSDEKTLFAIDLSANLGENQYNTITFGQPFKQKLSEEARRRSVNLMNSTNLKAYFISL
jgi:hypothetical protein